MRIPPVKSPSCTGADLVFLFDTQVYASLCLATAAEGSFMHKLLRNVPREQTIPIKERCCHFNKNLNTH